LEPAVQQLAPAQPLKRGDLGLMGRHHVAQGNLVVEGAGFQVLDPHPIQLATDIVAFGEAVERFAGVVLGHDLPFELDTMAAVRLSIGFPPRKARTLSIQSRPTCPTPGAHVWTGSAVQGDFEW
jgi:hypothetical protein